MEEDDNSLIPSKLSFEDLKQINQHGIEYWSARELQSLLGYSKWQRFGNAVEKAIESCKQSGNDPNHHFTGAGNPITNGKGRTQVVEDYHLSLFACYLYEMELFLEKAGFSSVQIIDESFEQNEQAVVYVALKPERE